MSLLIHYIFLIISLLIILFAILNKINNTLSTKKVDRIISNNVKQMNEAEIENYMKELAHRHKIITYKKDMPFLIRSMNQDWLDIKESYKLLFNSSQTINSLVPATQWIVDNYYIIEKEVKFYNQSSKNKLYTKLPMITEGHYKGFPRIFALANEMINSTGYHLDEDIIESILNSYQSVTPLTFNELIVFLDMLKICFINNINHITTQIVDSVKTKQSADKCMDIILEKYELSQDILELFDKYLPKDPSVFNSGFVTHIMYRLKEFGIEDDVLRYWLCNNENFEKHDIDLSEIVKEEGQLQAKLQVSMGTLIESLRMESNLHYENFFENVSCIEKVLQDDPANLYSKMDFNTRMDYHIQVRYLSNEYDLSEIEICQRAIELSRENLINEGKEKHSHVGYYLLGNGIKKLGKSFGHKPCIINSLNCKLVRPGFVFFAGIISISVLILMLSVFYTIEVAQYKNIFTYILAGIIMFVPSISIASELVGFIISKITKPVKLPSMDFSKSIPSEYKTLVVIPTLIANVQQVEKLIGKFEKYYLSNNDDNLFYALLRDPKESNSEDAEDDEKIISAIYEGINSLNKKYCPENPKFMAFTRKRTWNDSQKRWLGYERKRGMLEQLNMLILGEKVDDVITIVGNVEELTSFKYVLTVDEGVELTRDSAKKLVGIMAHPLNTPGMNADKSLVVEGYTIIQPRVGVRIKSALMTQFSKLFAGQSGIETYTPVIADLYQDVFGQATFTGKGIYDPRVFHEVLGGKLPENAILSHDLLESCYVRCATATNVKLMDDFPSNIASFYKREHRWIRGDWQLLPWILKKNPLSKLSKYKIFDNLRRSVMPISYLLLIFLGSIVLSWNYWIIATIVLFATLFPLLLHITKTTSIDINMFGAGFNILNYFRSMGVIISQGVIWFMLLPYRTQIALDAIFRTIYRTYISHKNMLEWVTAEIAEGSIKNDMPSYFRRMWSCIISGLLLIIFTVNNEYYIFGTIIGFIWMLAPLISYSIGVPLKSKSNQLSNDEIEELGIIARKTWNYFDDYFMEEYNWLIPDNYQEWPENGVASRTSTTNIGLQLICTLSARDFGYISILNMINRIEKVFKSLSQMEKWNGHFYNWYDIQSLQPLLPKYVSTVDSGNFIGSLIVLKNGLLQYKNSQIFNNSIYKSIEQTAKLANIELDISEPQNINELKELLNKIKSTAKKSTDSNINVNWKSKLISLCDDISNDIEYFNCNELNINSTINDLLFAENENAQSLIDRIDAIIKQIICIYNTTDFKPLYNEKRDIFIIGYNATTGTYDNSYYDLLASESRLASFIAIAKGDVPEKHWFRLGRMLTLVDGIPTLVSWSGTMFEYLMPNLFMKIIPNTLLEQTVIGAIKKQIDYGKSKNTPWGMSEAAYYRFDQHLNYQYRAIGVPGLGFSTNVGKYNVVAPYSTMLSINIFPREAFKNIQLLKSMGAEDEYGFYEAVDFKSPDNNEYKEHNIVKSFFAHHQGMSLIALTNYLNDNIMQERFHDEPIIQATDLILEEKQPSFVIIRDEQKDIVRKDVSKKVFKQTFERKVNIVKPPYPIAHVLSNNHYNIMITSDGSGLSVCNNIAINRWRPDYINDLNGMFFYIQDLNTQKYWSSFYQPTQTKPDNYQAVFSLDKVEFNRKDGEIDTKTEIIVSPQDNVEIRRLTITNESKKDITLEITSYFEVVIDEYNDDLAHPAFSKLFVETEFEQDKQMLLATRRPRGSETERKWIMHTVLVDDKAAENIEFETDRSKFIGRGNTLKNPEAITRGLHLSNTVGKVLDAIMSIRVRITIPAGKSKIVTYISGITDTRGDAMKLAFEYRKPHIIEDSYKLALFHKDVEMQYLNINSKQANAIQEMVGSIYYPSELMRAPENIISQNTRSQPTLWRFGISGDNPIILLRINDSSQIDTVKDAILEYEYFRMKGIKVDLIILNELQEGYFQELSQKVNDLINNIKVYNIDTRQLGVFLLQIGMLSEEERTLLLTVARIVLTGKDRLLSKRIRNLFEIEPVINDVPHKFKSDDEYNEIPLQDDFLELFNGIGGFSKDGSEYIINLNEDIITPSPWINVIANQNFGLIVSALGAGHSWALNSRENKLTTWNNDPVIEQPSEIIYIRDEDSGKYFTPTALPIREKTKYKIRHGFGYSVFEHNSLGIEQKTDVFVPEKDSLKIYKVTLKNKTDKERNMSLTYFADLVLGVSRETTAPYIVTSMDNTNGIFTAKNAYNSDFSNMTAFMFSSEKVSSYSGDKSRFIGNDGDLQNPRALLYKELPNKCGARIEPCGCIKVNVKLNPGEQKEVIFALGEVRDESEIINLYKKYKNLQNVEDEFNNIINYWKKILNQIVVDTPDNKTNYILNGWLLYQTIACRILARSAYYQASGAYGFRDQLQDTLSLLNSAPEIAREMIIRHSSRQFIEGDVQHWWHPYTGGRGVRTKISDDLLWLPYVVSEYISATGDVSILDVVTGYIEDNILGEDEHERYTTPRTSEQTGSIYEHCIKTIEYSLKFGEHGLPLIGAGDWNDGMNKVGINGKGESVWLAWFLYKVLNMFMPICEMKGDNERIDRYKEIADNLIKNVEENAWDGGWYLRAYFDDGTKLGSRQNVECQIDSISQSWSVISNGADKERALLAMESVKNHLVKYEDQLIQLLTPPFDKMIPDPGYIKGYIPGIRENGAQYTHAAVWTIIAFSQLKKGDTAYRLFSILNPINHTINYSECMKYKNEPYVMSADVYSTSPHNGRGGWSWYTGAAGWMYKAGIEWILGIRKNQTKLIIDPTIPKEWNQFSIRYMYGNSSYYINVKNPQNVGSGVVLVIVDSVQMQDKCIPLVDDGKDHLVEVILGTME